MEKNVILTKIADIHIDILAVSNIMKSIATAGLAFPLVYESLAIEAAMKMEKIACKSRHLIYSSSTIPKRELMKKTADIHEIKINHNKEIFTVTLPALLPKKKNISNSEFIRDPLRFALEEYFQTNDMETFAECVVVFEHIYNESAPSRRICDYDNIELKPVLDTVSAFAMTDDGGKYCDVYHTAKHAENDSTKISVMTKNKFLEWLAGQ